MGKLGKKKGGGNLTESESAAADVYLAGGKLDPEVLAALPDKEDLRTLDDLHGTNPDDDLSIPMYFREGIY